MELVACLLAVLLIGSTWVILNVLKKNEKLEQMIIDQQVYIDQISQAIEYSDIKLNELDAKNTFKSDDEIGWFFKNVLYIQKLLNDFKLNIYNEKDRQPTQPINPPNNTPIESQPFERTTYGGVSNRPKTY